MLKITSFGLSLLGVALLTGCPKKPTVDADAGAIVLNLDAGAPTDAAIATTDPTLDAASPLGATNTATTTAAHGCPTGQTTFLVDGHHACETRCNAKSGNNNECPEPTACIGVAPIIETDGGTVQGGEYCRTSPSGACTDPKMVQFWNTQNRPTCEVMCKTPDDTSCAQPATCKGNASLYMVNGQRGQLHRYCKK